jgi:L-asparaginase
MKHIVLLTTGGTIAMREEKANGGAVPSLEQQDLLGRLASLSAVVSSESICNLPSSHFSLGMLWTIRQRVLSHLQRPEVDGVVITHGTDVLEETAILLDLTIAGDKPIVLTGAMRTASDSGYDGPINLADSIQVASSPDAAGLGTLVCFNRAVHAARYVTKTHTQALDTFQSPDWGPVGRLDADGLRFLWRQQRFTIAADALEHQVALLKLTVGMDPAVLKWAVEQGAKGLVLETLGGGRVPLTWMQPLAETIAAGVTVVTASRCPRGRVGDSYGYVGAQASLRSMGCLPAGCLNGQKARIALMVALGAGLKGPDLEAAWQQITSH